MNDVLEAHDAQRVGQHEAVDEGEMGALGAVATTLGDTRPSGPERASTYHVEGRVLLDDLTRHGVVVLVGHLDRAP